MQKAARLHDTVHIGKVLRLTIGHQKVYGFSHSHARDAVKAGTSLALAVAADAAWVCICATGG